jgi:transposase
MKENKIVKRRRKFDQEFKQEVLKMVENGREVNDIAQSLGIGTSLIYRWRNSANGQMKPAGKVAPLMIDEEKIALRKRVKELEMDRDILKKALGVYSDDTDHHSEAC